jgi:glutamine cyclotransferase
MKRTVNSYSICCFVLLIIATSCKKEKAETPVAVTDSLLIPFKLKTIWKHDQAAFTEGLLIHNGKLFESTGQKQSWIGIVDIKTGVPDKKVVLDDQYFGEGITILNNKIYQLTWQNKIGFVYDLKSYKKIGEFTYTNEGWGLTHDSQNLIMSDGTEKLTYLDTVTLQPVKTIQVKDEKGIVKHINELEYVDGFIFANLWQTNKIIKIDPQTGRVVGRLDLSSLTNDALMKNPKADVLNGIAYHPTTKLLSVTGKHWTSIYVLQLN